MLLGQRDHFRVLVADDNAEIHRDIERVLADVPRNPSRLDELEAELFDMARPLAAPILIDYEIVPAAQVLQAANLVDFDRADLLDRLLNDEALAVRIMEEARRELPGQMAELAERLATGDSGAIAALAHGIKGAASHVSGTVLARTAARLELAARRGEQDKFPGILDEMRLIFTRLMSILGADTEQ